MSSSASSRNRGLEIGIALFLLFFFWWISAHRFYCGRPMSALFQIGLFLVGSLTTWLGVGHILLFIWGAWLVIDFLMIITGSLKPR